MQREVLAIVLCILAQAASAQCVAPSAKPATATPTAARAELIKTAAAGTRDDEPPAMTAHSRVKEQQQDHPRRGGTAMLLAALALMSGIALRRYGASNT